MNKTIIIISILIMFLLVGCDNTKKCEQSAKEMFPDKISLLSSEINSTIWTMNTKKLVNKWKDGSDIIENTSFILPGDIVIFQVGSEEGQNINYYYNKNKYLTQTLNYYKQVNDKKGNVLGHNKFKSSIVLKPLYGTDVTKEYPWKYGKENLTIMDFEIIDYNFQECEWMKK